MKTRETGYYWIKFNWAKFGKPERMHWEVAGWDARTQSWSILGATKIIESSEELIFFSEINETRVPGEPE